MRIPSELHGESLYRGTRSRHRPTQSWRRVIRLSIVLALVVVVMRQAARPGIYQAFFPEASQSGAVNVARTIPPSANTSVPTQSADATGRPTDLNTVASDGSNDLTSQIRQRFEQWVDSAPEDELLLALATWLRGELLPAKLDDSLLVGRPADAAILAVMIQDKLIRLAKDGTVWRAADGAGLYSTLGMHQTNGVRFQALQHQRAVPVVAGVLPLLQQPEVYRGRSLVAQGEVVRIEKISSPADSDDRCKEFGITSYWNLWLMPEDASRRPWMVVVSDLPTPLQSLTHSHAVNQTPTSETEASASQSDPNKVVFPVSSPRPVVEVAGEYLKRLSYQSASGAELTPVIVGHIRSYRTNGNPTVSAAIRAAEPSNGEAIQTDDEVPLVWIVVGSAVIGVLFSVWVFWRTSVLNRQLRQRRDRRKVTLGMTIATVFAAMSAASSASGQSLSDLLPGYDRSRMEGIVEDVRPSLDNPGVNVDEIAKLVFRMDRLSETVLKQRLEQSADEPVVGDAVAVDDTVLESQTFTVGSTLQEYLGIDRVEMLRLSPVDGLPRFVFARGSSQRMSPGDRVSGVAVRIRFPGDGNESSLLLDVAGRLGWQPAQPASPSENVLAMQGIDLGRLAEVDLLDRKPLSESDSPVFYPMIGASAKVAEHLTGAEDFDKSVLAMRENATDALPVKLLQNPTAFTGQWIRLRVETVRITRVAVQSEQRRREIGGDAYYEIDAIGDLGKVQLQIEVPDGEPVVMENRYPVTIVTRELPDFLQQSDRADGPLVTTVNRAIHVEGFFYRLWSYESDFMKQRGGKQFAPLIIAGVIEDLRPTSDDPMGVQAIGQIAAFAVVGAILAAIAFHWVTKRGDKESRKRRYG
ncbi:hypothetical protein [Rhodopirellula sallentina]|uniref:Putative membrane protein n=1 Tax=Rhodopirellula sallentina SM41 TaxID=1263870 RepID=M5UGW3_9BACT|nr:hypothetical protein [Rhodopirellula sallentina]EMI55243.1 putative membrane protein [Rhodopirellula sallentina SM41]